MVLSNADRQRRYKQRLKAKASSGVTPDDIERAARLLWTRLHADDPSLGSYDDRLALCQSPKGRRDWIETLPCEDEPEFWAEFGDDAELMAKVAAVVRAVRYPPPA